MMKHFNEYKTAVFRELNNNRLTEIPSALNALPDLNDLYVPNIAYIVYNRVYNAGFYYIIFVEYFFN